MAIRTFVRSTPPFPPFYGRFFSDKILEEDREKKEVNLPLHLFVDNQVEKSFQRVENSLNALKAEMKADSNALKAEIIIFKAESKADFNVFKIESAHNFESFKSSVGMSLLAKAMGLGTLAGGLVIWLGNLMTSMGVKWTPPQITWPETRSSNS